MTDRPTTRFFAARALGALAVALLVSAASPAHADVSLGGWMAESPDDISGFLTLSANDSTVDVALPFTFVVEGANYTTVTLSTNGWLELGGNTSGNSDPTNDCLPTAAHTNPFIAAYWDDLVPWGTNVRYGTVGTSPNRVFIVDLEADVPPSNQDLRYQVQLHERSNLITVRYRDTQNQANGQTATIGFQGAGGAAATAHALGCNAKIMDDNRPDEGWSADVGRAGQVVLASNTEFSPDDILGGSTLSGNNNTANTAIGFDVTIEGVTYSSLTLSTNGWIEFGANTWVDSHPGNDCLPTGAHTNPFLAMLWDDMETFGGHIRYGTLGTAPNRVFVADYEYEIVGGVEGSDDTHLQVLIHEGSSLISIRYRDKQRDPMGQTATIGFQGAGGINADAHGLTCNGRILDDDDDAREGWSVDPRRAGKIAVHGVMSSSPNDITGFTTLSGNDAVTNVVMPFNVVIDGTPYGSVAISTNGWLEFGGNTWVDSHPGNDCLPTGAHSNPFLAAYWDDMQTQGTNIRYGTVGQSPNRTFVVDYVMDVVAQGGSDLVEMQVQIHEGSNVINTKYRGNGASSSGQQATIGFQRAGGLAATVHPLGCNARILDDNRTDAGWSVAPLPICGNGILEGAGGESCDLGGGNGGAGTCCTASCGFRASGQVCRLGGGAPCDLNETCSGASSSCPGDDAPGTAGLTCRIGSSDACDPDEVCNGTPGVGCPSDVVTSSGTLCRGGSGDLCDPNETCTGVAGAACPANVVNGPSTVCRLGSGDGCDSSETCSGVPTAPCPGDDAPLNAGVVCRSGSGDSCDLNESCTGAPGAQCPADDAPGKAGTVCRISPVGDLCDGNETCQGIPGATCPADDAPGNVNVVCRPGSGDVCDPEERCGGVAGQGCPQNVVADPTTVCRVGSGDVCDPSETCTAVPGAPCPADVVTPNGSSCRSATGSCDVAEVCSGTAGQQCPADAFTPAGTSCDEDADTCTIDECDGNGTCGFLANVAVCGDGDVDADCGEQCDDHNTNGGDGCSPTCQLEGELTCASGPLSGCRRPFVSGKASILLKKGATGAKDQIKWKWAAGTRTTLAEYGNPLATTDYQVCVYDQTGLVLDATAPAGGICAGKPCWKPTGLSGYRYKNKSLAPDGIHQLALRTGADGKAKIQLAGRGALLAVPATAGLSQPVTVQIHSSIGRCWEAVYSVPASAQTATQFKDKAD